MSKKLFDRNISGKIFKPKFRRGQRQSSAYINKPENKKYTYDDFKDTNLFSSSSFRYGDKNFLVSTQQANIDYSHFENHTFFHSAVANVNEAFDRIVNFYPFDGTKKQIEEFEDTMTGFENYVFDLFPKNIGYLIFSGTQTGESALNGTYIQSHDIAGGNINSISSDRSGRTVLSPKTNPFTIEFFCNSPEQANDNQVIFQTKHSLSNNITIALSASNSTKTGSIVFGITSGSNYSYVTGTFYKGKFNHIAAIYDPQGDKRTKLLVDDIVTSSSMKTVFRNLDYFGNSVYIGKGDQVRLNGSVFNPQQTLSGSLDSLRFYHIAKDRLLINSEKRGDVYAAPDLKLHFKFNEPYGAYRGNDITLDSSGNSLHGRISNFTYTVNRATGSDGPANNELLKRNIVLFPDYADIKTLNTRLLSSGSDYDIYNPNLITKLIPPHYFEEGNDIDNFSTTLGKLGNEFSTFSDKSVGKKTSDLPGAQTLVKFLLVWAKFFDEIKIMIDTIRNFNHIEYNDFETVPDPFLFKKAKTLNIDLPSLFRNASQSQIIDGINLKNEYSNSTKTLNEIQNLIWRRILSDSTNLKMTKGTIDSMKSVFRSAGIEPDNIFAFREYGGSKTKTLNSSRENKYDVFKFLNFSSSIGQTISAVDAQGYPGNFPKIKSDYLSGSRVEVGNPPIRGSFTKKNVYPPHGISNNVSDGLFTSGSFTFEGLYDWEHGYTNSPESLIRMHITGSSSPSSKESCVVNLVSISGSLDLFIRDSISTSTVKHLFLTGVDVYDKDIWYVSFGRRAPHDIGSTTRYEYFLRAAKQQNGSIIEQYQTASNYVGASDSVFNNITSTYNESGPFLVIGQQTLQAGSSSKFLNDSNGSNVNSLAHSCSFTGLVSNIRFWSRYTTDIEWKERAKNLVSVGTENPLINYNFSKTITGSFERLIVHTTGKQHTTGSDTQGGITFFDFSQNNLHFTGSNFEPSKNIFRGLKSDYEILSDKFDLNYAKSKVRVRSFQNYELVNDSNYATIAPAYEVRPNEEVTDDNRMSIDMSAMSGLNENILTMFVNFDPIEDALGAPNLVFGDSYPKLTQYRKIYFNNLLEKIDLNKFRNLFKWIDNSFTDLMYSLVPRTTNFLGINFVYESHVLERNRLKYLFDEIYLKSLPRDSTRGNLLLSQFVGYIDKY